MADKLQGIETYGIDLGERIRAARNAGNKQAELYLVTIRAYEELGDIARKGQVQAAYDALGQFYSSTSGGEAWAKMEIAVEALTGQEYNLEEALAFAKKYIGE